MFTIDDNEPIPATSKALEFDQAEIKLLDLAITFTFWLHKMRFGSEQTPEVVKRLQDKLMRARAE